MNVQENIAFACPKDTPPHFVAELLSFTGLTMLASRKVQTLSGGQKQRVALARAIATRPSLLLLDEPLSAIDNTMRVQLQSTLLDVHKRFELTTILVSHDMDEIIKLSDQVVHLEQGKIQQIASPSEFFLNGNKSSHLTGEIVSVEDDAGTVFTVVLLNNRMIRIEVPDAGRKYGVGEKVEIVYKNELPEVRKL
jgi:molybdate transport system ATP-binding protein